MTLIRGTGRSQVPVKEIDSSPGSPSLYRQLEVYLTERILAGEWSANEMLPTEAELCEMYGVSRITVRQALARLASRGLVTRVRGKGTFIGDPRLTAGARTISSFTAEMASLGLKAGSRILDISVVTDETAAAHLDREVTDLFLRIQRLRTADGLPFGVQTTFLPADKLLGVGDLLTDDASLYGLLASKYGVVPHEAIETFTAAAMPKSAATLLDVRVGSPAFLVARTTYSTSGSFEFTSSTFRADRFNIRIVLRSD